MAVQTATRYHYIATSSGETAPVSSDSNYIPAGSTFEDPYLGTIQEWNGTDWVSTVTDNALLARAQVELTRPANATPYDVGDALSNSATVPTVLSLTLARLNANSGRIIGARLMTDQKTCVAQFKVHLYHTTPTAINDNSPMLLLYANKAKRIASFTLPVCSTADASNSTAAEAQDMGLNIPFVCAAADSKVYFLLETLTGFTPASGQKFTIELTVEQN